MVKDNIECSICAKRFHLKPSYIKKSKTGKFACSVKCSAELKQLTALYKTIEDIETNTNMNCKEYLEKRYLTDLKSSRFIAKEALKSDQLAKRITFMLNHFGIAIRQGSDALKAQWINNDERREETSKRAVLNIGANSEGRKKLIGIMQTTEYKAKASSSKRGKNNPMYGMTDELSPQWTGASNKEERAKLRKSFEDVRWRNSVFDRDSYTCQKCGDNKGHNLEAHHMNAWHWDEEGRYDIKNGITFCSSCHKAFHKKYGYKNNTRNQAVEYLSLTALKG